MNPSVGSTGSGPLRPDLAGGEPARLIETLSRRARFPAPGTAVVCGVSGGADSSALLVLAVAAGCAVTAVHVDHGLRPGSDAEADVVAALADRVGAAFRAERVVVEPGPNLEARAREARHRVLGPGALLGHTADDQAETVMLALLRGAGLDGLSGMSVEQHPLLGIRRHETELLCEQLGIRAVVDPMNTDPRYRRTRVRRELLPLAAEIAARDLVPILNRQADLLRDESALLDRLAMAIEPTDALALAAAPVALARRAVRRWLTAGGYPPDGASVGRVLAVARGESEACEISGGIRIVRSAQRLRRVDPTSSEIGDR